MRTALVLVLDAVGLTTLNYLLAELDNSSKKVFFPNLGRLGLGKLVDQRFQSLFGSWNLVSHYAVLNQQSAAADSVIGHREMMGIIDGRIYDLFPNGFPPAYITALEQRIGRKTMYNQMGGGVEVIEQNAEHHTATGQPIVYASKCDPLIQIAMNEAVIPVPEQHRIAETALALALKMRIPVTRAIARAFVRTPEGEYVRTANRHDAVLPIESKTLPDILRERHVWTVAVGKTGDLVNVPYRETIKITEPLWLDPKLGLRFPHPKRKDTNPFVVQGVINALKCARAVYRPNGTFVFANLVDTDALYGHTRDVLGAVRCIEEFDRMLPVIESELLPDDLLIVTADHGMEHRTDYGYHHKEPLPLLARRIGGARFDLETNVGKGLTKVGMLVAQFFGCADEFRCSITRIGA